jgi:RNA polymerase sigma-70 factor, ECF subfamily
MISSTIPNLFCDTEFAIYRESILSEQVPNGAAALATEDITLLERVREGDQAAMAEIFDRHSRAVYSVALHVLKDTGHAEDVMQEIFFQVWQNSASFVEARGSLRTWLLAVTRNRAIDFLRRRKPTDPVEDVILTSCSDVDAEAERNAMIEKVKKALKKLPEEQQQSMNLAYFEELSHAEISARTGLPLGTVKTRIRLALTSLRKALAA